MRLLLNLVDYIFHNADADASRGHALLARVLRTLVHKFGTLRWHVRKVEAAEVTPLKKGWTGKKARYDMA